MHIPLLSALGNALFSVGSGSSSADVTITHTDEGTQCTVNNLDDMRARAKKLLSKTINKGYKHFPINHTKLINKTVNKFINEDAICSTLVHPNKITKDNYDGLREKYKGKSMSPKKAKSWGMVAKRLGIEKTCPENYNWSESMFYNKVDSCEDVLDSIDGKGLPTVMYSVEMLNTDAVATVSDINIAPSYTKYANGGPIVCAKGDDYLDAYHLINIINGLNIAYIMRGWDYDDYSAWTVLKPSKTSCGKQDKKADNLMYNFGGRSFIKMDVEENGKIYDHTLIVTSVAAASSNPLAVIVPDNTAYHGFIGREFAKYALIAGEAEK